MEPQIIQADKFPKEIKPDLNQHSNADLNLNSLNRGWKILLAVFKPQK